MTTHYFYRTLLAIVLLSTFSNTAVANKGTFTAKKACAATKALRSDNPGNVITVTGQTYHFLDINKEPPTHYLINIPDAPVTQRRWVSIDCGTVDNDVVSTSNKANQSIELDSIENVLAASWQPTFCATSRGRDKPECQSQSVNRPDAKQFSIHGLWPDDLHDKSIFPCYCNTDQPVSCKKKRKPAANIELSKPLWEQLEILMPGVQSGLHLHEWEKHGSCYEDFISGEDKGADAEEYFAETVSLINNLNDSLVKDLFVSRLGKVITLKELKKIFDRAFGEHAGDRVFMNCSRIEGVNYISELWIGLGGAIAIDSDFGELMLSAPTTDLSTGRRSCQKGRVFVAGG